MHQKQLKNIQNAKYQKNDVSKNKMTFKHHIILSKMEDYYGYDVASESA
jgi:hypothetical protein